jgi:anti-sigma regulatory factor (Ser/Thr protein kinase)
MMTLNRETIRQAWRSWYSNELDPVGPAWLQWALTGVFCMFVALCFTVLGLAIHAVLGGKALTQPGRWVNWYGENLLVSMVIGYTIHALFAALIPWVGKARIRAFSKAQRAEFFAGVPLAGLAIGWPLGMWLAGGTGPWISRAGPGSIVGMAMVGALISFIFFQIFSAKARLAEAEKRAAESQLRQLQAQMEPHFLFNTLAGVLTLIDDEPLRAKAMLQSFTDYLRATLSNLRQDRRPLSAELDLAEAYLKLMHLRMEDRLRYTITASDEVRTADVPPLMLQPLIENAIRHGLEAKLQGGSVAVDARAVGGQLLLSVSDDGGGAEAAQPCPQAAGNGMALDNIRQRLRALFGADGSLQIERLAAGTRVTLSMPLQRST